MFGIFIWRPVTAPVCGWLSIAQWTFFSLSISLSLSAHRIYAKKKSFVQFHIFVFKNETCDFHCVVNHRLEFRFPIKFVESWHSKYLALLLSYRLVNCFTTYFPFLINERANFSAWQRNFQRKKKVNSKLEANKCARRCWMKHSILYIQLNPIWSFHELYFNSKFVEISVWLLAFWKISNWLRTISSLRGKKRPIHFA